MGLAWFGEVMLSHMAQCSVGAELALGWLQGALSCQGGLF